MKTTPFDSQTKVAGHPSHPMLVMFPIAFLSLAPVTDVVHLVTDERRWADFSVWLLVFALAGGAVAAGVGFLDWWGIPKGTRAKQVGLVHAAVNDVALLAAGISLLLRVLDDNAVGVIELGLALVAVGAVSAGGYLGGELVYKLGVAVDRDAFDTVEDFEETTGGVRPTRIVRG